MNERKRRLGVLIDSLRARQIEIFSSDIFEDLNPDRRRYQTG